MIRKVIINILTHSEFIKHKATMIFKSSLCASTHNLYIYIYVYSHFRNIYKVSKNLKIEIKNNFSFTWI